MRLREKSWLAGMVFLAALGLAGCSSNDDLRVFTAEILSDQPSDGDISFDPVNGFIPTNGPDTLFFGIDEANPNTPEYRAFLTFPLSTVPLGAQIDSAFLIVNIFDVNFSSTIHTFLDLVTYFPGALVPADYSSDPLSYPGGGFAFRSFDFFSSDIGFDVNIEVTSLMREAQRRGLPDFQVRFMLDTGPGFVEIDDRPTVTITAPLLIVNYF